MLTLIVKALKSSASSGRGAGESGPNQKFGWIDDKYEVLWQFNLEKVDSFYKDIFGLDLLMNLGFIRTYGSSEEMPVQISFASEGGSGTAVPEFSIEVDDIEEVLRRAKKANIPIEYGPVSEPWDVRRFYIRGPFGKLINVLRHE